MKKADNGFYRNIYSLPFLSIILFSLLISAAVMTPMSARADDDSSGRSAVEEVADARNATVETSGSFADLIRGQLPEQMLERTVYFENWQWIALLLTIILGIVAERLVIYFFTVWIRKLLSRTKIGSKYKIDKKLIKPLGVLAMSWLWSVLVLMTQYPAQAEKVLFFATQVMIVLSGIWTLFSIVDMIGNYFQIKAAKTDNKTDDLLVPMIRRIMKVLVTAMGLLFIADNLNIDITSLLAGLGIGGFAIALAAKDTVENVFGSLTVLFDKPFEIGDWVKIGDVEGTVTDVGFRTTRILTFYNSLISMPNSRLVNSAVDNLGKRQYRRISTKIGVQYDTSPEKIEAFCEGIREIIRTHPHTRKDFYLVYLNEFAASSLNILLYVFHEVPDWATELRERHRLFADIIRLAKKLGVEFAFPTQTLHLASTPESLEKAGIRQPVPMPNTQSEASLLGRSEADAIVAEFWGGGSQVPVSFTDPDSMRADKGKA